MGSRSIQSTQSTHSVQSIQSIQSMQFIQSIKSTQSIHSIQSVQSVQSIQSSQSTQSSPSTRRKNPHAAFWRIRPIVPGFLRIVIRSAQILGRSAEFAKKRHVDFWILKRLKNREDGSDFDDFRTKSIASTRSFFSRAVEKKLRRAGRPSGQAPRSIEPARSIPVARPGAKSTAPTKLVGIINEFRY